MLGGGGGQGVVENGTRGPSGSAASGGDAVGWWDDGDTNRSLTDVSVEGGTPGGAGGPGGEAGSAIRTLF
jgi:hypothetical protein